MRPTWENRSYQFPHVSTIVANGKPAETADGDLALAMVRLVIEREAAPR